MIRHTLLVIFRNFKRFKSTFLINLIGLSSGLTCAILIYLWVADELSMDKFHTTDQQLFQVMTNQNRPDDIVTLGYGPVQLQDEMPAEFPEIEYAVGSSGVDEIFTLVTSKKKLTAAGQFAGTGFFKIFSYPLLRGNADQVLADKNSIVISEELAMTLFNSADDAMGKMLAWQVPGYSQQVIVSGIFANVPDASSVQFDFVLSYEMYEDIVRQMGSMSWGNHNAITYLKLNDGADLAAFNAKIENFIMKRDPNSIITIFAKPYSEGYLYGQYENGHVVGGRITYVKLFSAIAIFIVLIACINFMNLTTAKASRRVKEVGIKKSLGASRRTLITHYLGESLLMTIVSMAIAILLVDLLLPQFNAITGKHLSLPSDRNPVLVLAAITVVTGLIAGSYPALYLSGFNPAQVLKGNFNIPGGELWARKGLVIVQFTLAIVFMVSVWVVYKQMEYVQTKHLGFDKENIIYFKMEGDVSNRFAAFCQELEGIPGVVEVSGMNGSVMGATSFTTGSFDWKGRDPNVIVQFEHLGIDYDMIELLDIEISSGRSFSRSFPSDSTGIVFNETAIKMMGLTDPIGERFNLWGRDYKIIGVVKDFHFETLHENVKPFFFRITPGDLYKVMVKLEAGREEAVLDKIKTIYNKFNSGYIFDYQFLDTEYEKQYVAEQRVETLSKYFSALAILISCLGLLGLATFAAERRIKEVGIRKVLGSSSAGIVYLLCSDFNRIVCISILIGLPVSYYGTRFWLDTFAYRIHLHWWYFACAGVIALAIAWLTIGVQAWKAARVNPVKCLRDD